MFLILFYLYEDKARKYIILNMKYFISEQFQFMKNIKYQTQGIRFKGLCSFLR